MFTVLANTRNSNLYLIAALAMMAIILTSFAIAPSVSTPRTVLVPVTDNSEVAVDYYQRHRELAVSAAAEIDLMGDFSLRHPDMRVAVANAIDLNNDFYQRHPDWISNAQVAAIPVTGISESSDYFQRHSELSLPAASAVELTDYFNRHSESLVPARQLDLSDYFLRH